MSKNINKKTGALLLLGLVIVASFGFGLHYHDYQINQKIETLFFCITVAGVLLFEWLLHKRKGGECKCCDANGCCEQ